MATVHVFIGQCGNQLGATFLDTLANEAAQSGSAEYELAVSATHFRPALAARGPTTGEAASLPQPRCVMVDMEPKVIEQAIARVNAPREVAALTASAACGASAHPFFSLTPQQCVTRGEGSGNNWAYGYHHQGQSRCDAIMACLRRENEAADNGVACYHVVHGVAGGTGSGVGSLVAEVIKDHYPTAALVHSVVWPFESGEVVTQWYNLVLAMRSLRECADGACVLYNDVVRRELMGRLAHRGLRDAAGVDYAGINDSMSRLLTPLHLPQLLYDAASVALPAQDDLPLRQGCMQDVIEALALDPCTKFFCAAACPAAHLQRTSTDAAAELTTWPGVLQDAARWSWQRYDVVNAFAARDAPLAQSAEGMVGQQSGAIDGGVRARSRCCLWALRGVGARSDGLHALRRLLAPPAGAPHERYARPLSALLVSPVDGPPKAASNASASRSEHAVTVYGPSSDVGTRLARALRKAETLLHARAFVHHFERYGVERADLQDAIATMWDTALAYGARDDIDETDDR